MGGSRCSNCGGSSFKADRALAGRLVCVKCGALANSSFRSGDFDYSISFFRGYSRKRIIGLALIFIVAMLIII